VNLQDQPSEGNAEQEAKQAIDLINRVRKFHQGQETPRDADETIAESRSSLTDHPLSFGDIEILEEIGVGGFGVVYRGLDHRLDRQVAIKIPKMRTAISRQFRDRFEREARAAAALSHPNIVPVFEAGTIDSTPFIASQFVLGQSLDQWAGSKSIEPKLAARMIATLSDALAHAHQRGIFHRDIKPSNVLVEELDSNTDSDPADLLRLTDFGLAKVIDEDSSQTQTGSLIGTPAYMAPEMIEDPANANSQADIFSLGSVFYELLTGKPPFVGDTVVATLDKVRKSEPWPPSAILPVPQDLEAVCLKCLKKSPSERYETAIELRDDLQRFLSGEPVLARRPSTVDRIAKWSRRNPVALALIGTVLTATMLIGGLLWRSESLRRESEVNLARFEAKSKQLTNSINQFYELMADSPELSLAGLEPLKQRLLVQVKEVRNDLAEESTDDLDAQIELWQTQNSLASLAMRLGDRELTMELVDDVLEQIEQRPEDLSGSFDIASITSTCHLLRANVGSFRLDPALVRESVEQAIAISRDRMSEFGELQDQTLLVNALCKSAEHLLAIGENSQADALSTEVIAMWRTMPVERFQRQAGFYSNVLFSRALTAAESNKKDAIQICDEMVAEANRLLIECEQPSVDTQWHCAEVFRIHGFTLRNNPERSAEAIASSERALEIANELAETHLWTAYLQRNPAACRYPLALLHHIFGDSEISVPMFMTNVAELEKCKKRFPRDANSINGLLSNNLTMLSIHHKHQKNWAEQEKFLDKSRELLLESFNAKNPNPRTLVLLAGQNLERAANQMLQGQFEVAMEYLEDAIATLESESIVAAGGEEATRFLTNAVKLKRELSEKVKN
jgi:serine/threonine protein kinase